MPWDDAKPSRVFANLFDIHSTAGEESKCVDRQEVTGAARQLRRATIGSIQERYHGPERSHSQPRLRHCRADRGALLPGGAYPRIQPGRVRRGQGGLKERDRLWDQTQKLRAAGKLSEAIAAAEAMLAIERKVLPAGHADLAVSLDWLAMIYSDREDFAAAKVARQQALEVLRKRYGETHWKVTDARLALEDVERRAGMTRDQRQKLAEADRLNREVVPFIGRASMARL